MNIVETVVGSGMKLTCSRDELVQALGVVSRGVSSRGAVQILAGILLQAEGDSLQLAATDMELSLRTTLEAQVEGEGATVVPGRLLVDLARLLPDTQVVFEHKVEENTLEAIIPARALEELRRIAGGTEAVELGVQDNQVVFGVDGIWLTTRRIDGQFPNYKQLVPEQFEHEVTMPREELLEVVRRTSVMAERNSPLRLRFAEGELTLSAQTQDVGESKETVPAPFTGEPLEIGFNPQFLRDGLESVEGEQVLLRLINPLRPAVIAGEGGDFAYLIMPIRLPG